MLIPCYGGLGTGWRLKHWTVFAHTSVGGKAKTKVWV